MCLSIRVLALATALLPAAWAGAGPATSVAGHWDGAIHAPVEDVVVSVDLAADESGKLGGTFSNPGQKLTGFPLWSTTVDGEAVKLELKTGGPGVQMFDGRLSADGRRSRASFDPRSRRTVHAETQRRGADRSTAAQRRDRRQARGVVGRIARGRRPVIAARADADESCRPNLDGYVGPWRLPPLSPSPPKTPR